MRHIFLESQQMKAADSVCAHLDKISGPRGQQIVRGQQVGTIGTNRGMYLRTCTLKSARTFSLATINAVSEKTTQLLRAEFVYRPAAQALRRRTQRARGDQYVQRPSERTAAAGRGAATTTLRSPVVFPQDQRPGESRSSPLLLADEKGDSFRVNRFSDLLSTRLDSRQTILPRPRCFAFRDHAPESLFLIAGSGRYPSLLIGVRASFRSKDDLCRGLQRRNRRISQRPGG